MITHRIGAVYTLILLFLLLLTSCAQSSTSPETSTSPSTTRVPSPISTVTSTVLTTPAPKLPPTHYTSHLLLRGVGRPDDLAFDQQGRLLFTDEIDKTISRLNTNGSVTVLLHDSNGPEGLVVLPDGTMIFAEQESNRIVALAPGARTPAVLHVLPGIPSSASCKHGVDGMALDPTTNTLIVPDSPTGDVYRLSLDGTRLTLLASGIVRPVGAGVDAQGNMYIADECGGAIWRITPAGKTTRIGGFGMPDDVVPDGSGNVLVIDLQPDVHALIRLNPATGKRETLASQGYIEPQGLVIDLHGNIYVSDDYANIIVKYTPA